MSLSLAPKFTILNLLPITFQYKPFILIWFPHYLQTWPYTMPSMYFLIMPIIYTISQFLKDLTLVFMKQPWQPG